LIHKDGSVVRVLLHSDTKVKLCFTSLDYYYSRLDNLLAYYNELLNMMMHSIYYEARDQYRMIYKKDFDLGLK